MCVSCGCGKLNDDHGDSRNITMKQLESAADASHVSVAEVVDNIAAAKKDMVGSGQKGS